MKSLMRRVAQKALIFLWAYNSHLNLLQQSAVFTRLTQMLIIALGL
jgi:hypothetical protein